MSDPQSFQALIDRVRTGDVQAAEELVRRYEPTIRRVARVRLVDPRLRRQLDTMDICQSVLGSFFVRAALGEYDLGSPDQLLRLLAAMTRNKLANQKRHQRAARRDYRRVEPGGLEAGEVAGRDGPPSRQVAARELLQEAHRRFTPAERRLLDLRDQGREWSTIAAELGGSPEALRKKLARAIERVAWEIGLDEPDDG
ncbi:MAG: sigma-70 family RNA polymerase sigma factor [Planctomycetaceae bacterium]|nr:sigma-70 family RNA polymerase sigma factor [Planctomycetaceae bacterium]MBV8317961.1 sigma-70 family RNA polymerase sigma factor [Planctomycetaceae bacterium]MBV8382595.1 sigma-70 family RNA polymerase sigma factor [Planctomycetaceae bacterium]MBV8611115.1 sigma-70 family RNA polymerase sigma factor [Singulisphaera sp.]